MVDVVVVGAGPTGLMLAGELTLAGVDVAIVERRPTPELVGSRAGGFHARTIEILDQRGIADRFLAEGQTYPVPYSGRMMLDISDFPTRHPYTLGLWQNHIERILAGWVDELAVPIRRGVEVTGFVQDDDGVDVQLAEWRDDARAVRRRRRRRAQRDPQGGRDRLPRVGGDHERHDRRGRGDRGAADGHHVRRQRPPRTELHGGRADRAGGHERASARDHDRTHAGRPQREPDRGLRHRLRGAHPTWISRFTDATRQAAAYRSGRVLLAGDAAHIHSPAGGQGIGLGIQDAVNLGWKLAQVVKGISPESLLDTYHAERHPADARALEYSKAVSALQRHDARIAAVRDLMDELVAMDEPRRHVVGLISGLDVRYDLGEGHPLLGRRMPDLDLVTGDGVTAGLLTAPRGSSGVDQLRDRRGASPWGRGRIGCGWWRRRTTAPGSCR